MGNTARVVRRKFARAASSLGSDQNFIPYCSVFETSPTFSFPKTFSAKDYPGLLFCHICKDGANQRVIAYWSDEQHFKGGADQFKTGLCLGALGFAGMAIEIKRPPEKFWKRFKTGTSILAFVALLGALSALRDYYAVLFAVPDIAIAHADPGRLDAVENTRISSTVTVLSQVRSAPSRIEFTSGIIQSRSGGISPKLEIETKVLPSLVAGQSIPVKIFAIAPKHTKAQVPDIYDL